MKLSKMQDIGGCRAVMASVEHVRQLVRKYERSKHNHRFLKAFDYISYPKESGYRSYHLVYQYQSYRSPEWNGLRIEVQLRTRLQHAWATAVEAVGTFTQQGLKASLGDPDWWRFFALMGTAIS